MGAVMETQMPAFGLPARAAILDAFTKLRKATVSCVISVRLSAWNSSALTGRILMKLDI